MEIWLLRHAVAEERSGTGRDSDRTLTEDGHRRAREVGRGLAALEPGIELILCSPYARARQTAEPVARALKLTGKLRETRALEPERDPDDVLAELRAEGVASVLLVAGRPGLVIPMKKAALARLTWEGSGPAALRALLPARVMGRVASSEG
jgi:phosphohistidine phosphatase